MKAHLTLVLLLAVCAGTGQASVVTLGADKDNAIVFSATLQDNSNGGGPAFFAGADGNTAPHRGLLSFDFSSIPTGATITNVQLTLTLGQVAGGTGAATSATIGLFDLSRNWGEGTASSVSTSATTLSGAGSGVGAGPGDATWNAAASPGTLWTTAGGDHAASASASLFLPNNVINTSFTWLSTPQLVADVQGWLTNPATNFGWEVINANEVSTKTIYGFYSSEWHTYTAAGGNAGQEPALQVTYAVPEPGPGAWLAAATAVCVGRRRRHGFAA